MTFFVAGEALYRLSYSPIAAIFIQAGAIRAPERRVKPREG